MSIKIPVPMLATPGGLPFTSAVWLYEIKFDGYRCMARAGSGPELRTKSGTNCTGWYPEVAEALAKVPGGPHVIDGEVCVLDDCGRSDFECPHARSARRRWYRGCHSVTYCAFDLLFEDGRNIMGLPLVERKARLAKLIAGAAGVLIVGDLLAEAALFQQAVVPLQLEGFVAKRRASAYQPGLRSRDWMKIKRKGPCRRRDFGGKRSGANLCGALSCLRKHAHARRVQNRGFDSRRRHGCSGSLRDHELIRAVGLPASFDICSQPRPRAA